MLNQKSEPNLHFSDMLPDEFATALSQIDHDDNFSHAVEYAARLIDCEFLFEVPAFLSGSQNARTVVFGNQIFSEAGGTMTFIIFDGNRRKINILSQNEIPESILCFSRSYSEFLHQAAKFIPYGNASFQRVQQFR